MSEGVVPSATGSAALARFGSRLDAFQVQVNGELARFLAERKVACGPEAEPLVGALEALVRGGGKRLRPALVSFSYRGCGGRDEAAALTLAMSTELLHTYLLIHDDIMDHAEMRRGLPATHARFAARHRERGWPGDAEHYGRSMAILVGDLGCALAVELFATACREASDRADRVGLERAFFAMCQEVSVGQYREMHLQYGEDADEDDLLRILRLKSGRYSVERPIELGARFAGAPEEMRRPLAAYGRAVGEAFQLRDDVLGVFGEAEAVGKPVGSDLAEGKHTLLIYHTLRKAEPEAAKRLRALLGRTGLGRGEVEQARRIIRRSGGLDAVRAMIERRLASAGGALETLDKLAFNSEAHSFFEGLIGYSRERDR